MRARERIYRGLGFTVLYETGGKYRGSGAKEVCIATRGNEKYFAFSDPGHYTRIMQMQESIPRMAKFSTPAEKHILMRAAPGRLLWDMDHIPDPEKIARQLIEFAEGTASVGLIHGDLRPWNVMVDDESNVLVIDWCRSKFVADITIGDDYLCGHLRRNYSGQKIREIERIDLTDADRVGRLMRGHNRFHELWPDIPGERPVWCRV